MKLRTALHRASILCSFCTLIGYCLPFWLFDQSYSLYEIFYCIGFPLVAWAFLLHSGFLLLFCVWNLPFAAALLGVSQLSFLLSYLRFLLREASVSFLLSHIAPGAWCIALVFWECICVFSFYGPSPSGPGQMPRKAGRKRGIPIPAYPPT